MNRRKFIKRSLIATPVGVAAVAGYSNLIERHLIEIVPVNIPLGLPRPLKIAVFGDIHFDPLFETDYIRSVVNTVNNLTPDLVFLTGDFISLSIARLPELTQILSHLVAPLGVFAIQGNHDQWFGRRKIIPALTDIGITVLNNQSIKLPQNDNWYLTGLQSWWSKNINFNSLKKTPSNSRHILLVHEPDVFNLKHDSRIALQVSGHTHGGQIRIPLYGAILLPNRGKHYQMGLYQKDHRYLYVNRGIGTINRHYRLNCRPEITLLHLS